MWIEYLETPQFIQSLFEKSPSLNGFTISMLNLLSDDPALSLRIYLSQRPDHLPKKWRQDANSVGFTHEFISIESVKINGWSNNDQFDLTIEKSASNYGIELMIENSKTNFQCQFITIKDIEGYSIS